MPACELVFHMLKVLCVVGHVLVQTHGTEAVGRAHKLHQAGRALQQDSALSLLQPCVAAHDKGESVVFLGVIDRHEAFRAHLSKCKFVRDGDEEDVTADEYAGGSVQKTITQNFKTSQKATDENEFERLLLEFQVDNDLSTPFFERASTARLLRFLDPPAAAVLPSRRELGTRILSKHTFAMRTAETTSLLHLQEDTRGRVSFLPDVWQNVAKTYLHGYTARNFRSLASYATTI